MVPKYAFATLYHDFTIVWQSTATTHFNYLVSVICLMSVYSDSHFNYLVSVVCLMSVYSDSHFNYLVSVVCLMSVYSDSHFNYLVSVVCLMSVLGKGLKVPHVLIASSFLLVQMSLGLSPLHRAYADATANSPQSLDLL